MNIIGDLHTHTLVSGHAYGTVRENALAASEKGLKILGITEHAPGITGTCSDFYFRNLAALPGELYGVKMFYGSEINILNDGTLSLSEENIRNLDYAIAGMHTLCYENVGAEKNTDNMISCIKHDKVKIISHPDDDHTPLDYDRLVPAAGEYGVALEVNNSSLIKWEKRWNCFENYHKMLKLCMKYRVPVVVDSDAHDPFFVGEFRRAIELLEKEQFDESLILNTSTEKIAAFFDLDLTRVLPRMGV